MERTYLDTFLEASTAGAVLHPKGTGSFTALPEGYTIRDLEEFQTRPNRVRNCPEFRDPKSCAAYVNAFNGACIAYAAPYGSRAAGSAPHMRVVIGHSAGDDASFHDHAPVYCPTYPPEYAAWAERDGKGMSQTDFGLFLEDRAKDVKEPDAASIYEMVMAFEATKRVEFKSTKKLHNGSAQISYTEENAPSGAIKVPEAMTLFLPVYEGQEPQPIEVRLRYRIESGNLRFQIDIADRERLEREAFERGVDAFSADAAGRDIPVLWMA